MGAKYESPHIRRLRSDLVAMQRLQSESAILKFQAEGSPVRHYILNFRGTGLMRLNGKVLIRTEHVVEIKLGTSYPRTIPEIRWLTPIYHPNVSEIGMVCLGAYGTHWVPSLMLDELCVMLWDIARYCNYDIRSPYNREAALWAASQTKFAFPLDARPLRDIRAALGRIDHPQPGTVVENSCLSPPQNSISSHDDVYELEVVPELEIRLELDEDAPALPAGHTIDQSEVVFLD